MQIFPLHHSGQNIIPEKPEEYVDIKLLLASNEKVVGQEKEIESIGIVNMNLEIKQAEIAEYSAYYAKIASVDSTLLKESIGKEVEGAEHWYKVSGQKNHLKSGYDAHYGCRKGNPK